MDLHGPVRWLPVRVGVKRQISQAILGVAILLILGLGVPLAIVVQRFYEDRAEVELQRRAAETITEIILPLDPGELASVASERDAPGEFTVYDAEGRRLIGAGPERADANALAALGGRSSSAHLDHELVLTVPITDRRSEATVGAVRVARELGSIDRQVRRAWFVMGAAAAAGIGGAWALARAQGERLAQPIIRLAAQADRLGRGEFGPEPELSGIEEVDTVAATLVASSERLAATLARERAFSADVSHQLRTPLTGLRLQLERAERELGPSPLVAGALDEVLRLEGTIEHLLALARDISHVTATLDVAAVLAGVDGRWSDRLAGQGRALRVDHQLALGPVHGSDGSVGQVLDVLVDNSTVHGAGTVTVRARPIVGGFVFEVEDEGPGIDETQTDLVFGRRHGSGHGIGLALARSIAEAEGGRLLLASAAPPRFLIVLAVAG